MFEAICNKNKFVTELDSEADEMDRRSFMNFKESSRITIGKSKPFKLTPKAPYYLLEVIDFVEEM